MLEDPSIGKIGQNLKYDWIVFQRAGIELKGIIDDSMLAAYSLDPTRASYSMDALAREELGTQTITFKDVTGTGRNKISFDEVAIDIATDYAAEDAAIANKLSEHFNEQLAGSSLNNLYRDLELPLLPVLAKMESTGIRIDVDKLRAMSKEFGDRLADTEAQAEKLIGKSINLASPKQLSHLFFEELGYPVIKKTKTGYSTDQEVLETLSRDYELPQVVLDYRLLAKLKSTYIDALPKLADPKTNRVHTSYNQTGTATGRLSSTSPNLQNIPIRGEAGRRIRSAFIPKDDWCLIAADYSQIELRVLAHLCNDQDFVEAFVNGEDIHARTAQQILTGGAAPDDEARRQAKAINFGILYGQSEFGLAKQLNISRAEAKDYITAYFDRYPKIRTFLDQCIADGARDGYVTTLAGRRRALPDLHNTNTNVRRAAERIAMNTPIQGSAADLIKQAMLNISDRLEREKLESRMLLQVHDELVLEAPAAERDAAIALVKEEMENVMELRVPLLVGVGHGESWDQAH